MYGAWRNVDEVELATLAYVDWFNTSPMAGASTEPRAVQWGIT